MYKNVTIAAVTSLTDLFDFIGSSFLPPSHAIAIRAFPKSTTGSVLVSPRQGRTEQTEGSLKGSLSFVQPF